MTGPDRSGQRIAQCLHLIKARRIIADSIGPHFVQLPVWDMLLELYLAHHEGRDVYLGSLCMVADTSLATAYRRTMDMQKGGLVDRIAHSHDRRRIRVQISTEAIARMDAMLNAIAPPCQALD